MNETEIEQICNETRHSLQLEQKNNLGNLFKLGNIFNEALINARKNHSLTIQLNVLEYNERVITAFISSIDDKYNVVKKIEAGEHGVDYGDPGRAPSYILHIARKF